jgi:O-antigen/teichoic acid export membrane protein
MYIFSPGISIAKKTIAQLCVALISSLVGMIANWILVPSFGLIGAAIATLFSSIIFLCLWFYIGQKYYYIYYAKKNVLYASIFYAALMYLDLCMQSLITEVNLLLFLKILIIIFQAGYMVIIGLISFKEINYALKWLRQRVSA